MIEEKELDSNIIENDKYNKWGLNIPLYLHQQISVSKMEEFEMKKTIQSTTINDYEVKIETSVGILADKTGSGKTLTVISFLTKNEEKEEINLNYEKIFYSTDVNNFYYNKVVTYKRNFIYFPYNIIVVLPSVFNQWKHEFSHSRLDCYFISKNKDIEKFNKDKRVIVITYNRYNQFVRYLNELQSLSKTVIVKRIFFDEIIYDQPLLRLQSNFIWIISATNYFINHSERQNRTSFLKYIMSSVEHKYIHLKNSDEIIQTSYQLPKIYEHIYRCYSYYDNFSNILPHEINQMLAADDLAGAISLLGGQYTNTINLKNVIIQKEKENHHKLEAKLKYYEDISDEKQIEIYIKKIEMNKKDLIHLEDRLNRMDDNCPICFEEIKNKVVVGCCKNVFCNDCIINIIKSNGKCAFCREKLDFSKMLYADNKEQFIEHSKKEDYSCNKEENNTSKNVKCSKLNQLINILKDKKDGKFILFSEFNNTFQHITEELKRNKISFCELKGSVDRINNILEKFNEGEITVLFLNSKFNGTGINLQNSTDIIFYHKMQDIIEQQNIGRAMRIGRKEPLHIHRLISLTEN